MGIKFNADSFIRDLKKLEEKISTEMTKQTDVISAAANIDLQANLYNSVYGTEPGSYIRTGYLKSYTNTNASTVNTDGVYAIRLASTADYASDIEYGTGDKEISESMLRQLSEAAGGVGITFGRSGRQWMLPGPFIMPATIKSRLSLENAFSDILNKWGNK